MDSTVLKFLSKPDVNLIPILSKDYEEEYILTYTVRYLKDGVNISFGLQARNLCKASGGWFLLPEAYRFDSPWSALAHLVETEKLT